MAVQQWLSPARTLLPAWLLLLVGCAAEVEGPTLEESREAGRKYGEVIVETISTRATQEEMESLCGDGADDGDPRTSDEVDAFVEGCLEVVEGVAR